MVYCQCKGFPEARRDKRIIKKDLGCKRVLHFLFTLNKDPEIIGI